VRFVIGLMIVTAILGAAVAAEVGWRTHGRWQYPDADPPLEFSPEKNVVWATPLPEWSNATPVVIEDRIFVCAEPNALIAVNKADGKILWAQSNPVTEVLGAERAAAVGEPKTHAHNGYASATPVSDGKRVFAVFGNGIVAAYTIAGERLWIRFVEKQPINDSLRGTAFTQEIGHPEALKDPEFWAGGYRTLEQMLEQVEGA